MGRLGYTTPRTPSPVSTSACGAGTTATAFIPCVVIRSANVFAPRCARKQSSGGSTALITFCRNLSLSFNCNYGWFDWCADVETGKMSMLVTRSLRLLTYR